MSQLVSFLLVIFKTPLWYCFTHPSDIMQPSPHVCLFSEMKSLGTKHASALPAHHVGFRVQVAHIYQLLCFFSSSVLLSCFLFCRYWHEERHWESNSRRTSWYHLEICYGEFVLPSPGLDLLQMAHAVRVWLKKKKRENLFYIFSPYIYLCYGLQILFYYVAFHCFNSVSALSNVFFWFICRRKSSHMDHFGLKKKNK